MDFIVWIWLGLLVLFIVFELITTSLTTIWFAGGALVAFVMALVELPVWAQIVAFFVVSIVLLIFTRPVSYEISQSGRREDQCGQSYRTDCKSHCRYQ